MRRAIAVCLVALLLPTFGCGRRITVQNPQSKVIINDRVVDILADQALAESIAKVPPPEQAALIREWMASKERLAQAQLSNEDKRNVSFWGVVTEILKVSLPAVVGYYLAK